MADQGNPILSVDLSANTFNYRTRTVHQYDHGLKLCLRGIGLPSIQVHFTNENMRDAMNFIFAQNESGDLLGDIPDILLTRGESIIVYVYYEDSVSGYTVKRIFIPVTPRAKPENISTGIPDIAPINELASQLQDQINQVENQKEPGGTGSGGRPGNDGISPTVNVEPIDGGHRISITDVEGTHLFDVMDGGYYTPAIVDNEIIWTASQDKMPEIESSPFLPSFSSFVLNGGDAFV